MQEIRRFFRKNGKYLESRKHQEKQETQREDRTFQDKQETLRQVGGKTILEKQGIVRKNIKILGNIRKSRKLKEEKQYEKQETN